MLADDDDDKDVGATPKRTDEKLGRVGGAVAGRRRPLKDIRDDLALNPPVAVVAPVAIDEPPLEGEMEDEEEGCTDSTG